MTEKSNYELLVRASTPTKKLAGMIRARYRENIDTEICLAAIGVSAVNQAMKSLVELNKIMISSGYIVSNIPMMEDRLLPDRNDPAAPPVQRTVIIIRLLPKKVA